MWRITCSLTNDYYQSLKHKRETFVFQANKTHSGGAYHFVMPEFQYYSRIFLFFDFYYFLLFLLFQLSYHLVVITTSFLWLFNYCISFKQYCDCVSIELRSIGNSLSISQDRAKAAYTPSFSELTCGIALGFFFLVVKIIVISMTNRYSN